MIYTKTGDKGTTSLVGGTRVLKCDDRVEAYGTVDELNSHVGLLAELIRQDEPHYFDFLKQVQHNLFIVQTLLATEKELPYELPKLADTAVTDL
jgi:cob(I)alamin adenosyltransferase